MILVYLLFALTLSTILMVVFDAKIPDQKRSDAFILFFAALMLIAWAVDEWVLPIVAIEGIATWVPGMAVSIFGLILVVSAILSARSQGPIIRAGVHHSKREDVEAIGFDIVLLFLIAAFGIMVLRNTMIE
jgi:hypothetical protein